MRLPAPTLKAGKSLAEALHLRRTTREMSNRALDAQLLSDLLFAARGVNRARGPFGAPGITAASASNSQEIDVYVALSEGVYLFESGQHHLVPVISEDVRRLTLGPRQPPVSPDAPVQLVYVVDLDKLEHTAGFEEPGLHDPEVQKSYYFVDTGLIAANVYLFAASQGLGCWFHNCDRAALTSRLSLRSSQRVLFAQTVGILRRPSRGPNMRLSGNTVLITGGATGIGYAMAEAFLRVGSEVIICGRREARLHEAGRRHPSLRIRRCDVANANDRLSLIDWAAKTFTGLNVLVNNAGIQRDVDLTKGVAELQAGGNEIAINLEAPIVLAALAVPHLAGKANSAIINVSSGLGFVPAAKMPVYSATKAGIHAFSMALRHQLARVGIKVFEVVPPALDTELNPRGARSGAASRRTSRRRRSSKPS